MPHLYNAILTTIFVIVGCYIRLSKRNKNVILFLIWILLTLVAGLRSVGTLSDTSAYHWYYTIATTMSFTDFYKMTGFDMFYYALNWISANIGIPWQFFLLTVESFIIGSVVLWAKYNSSDPFFSLLMYECMLLLTFESAIRQGLAIAFILNGYNALNDKKTHKAIIYFMLAFCSHISSIVFLLFIMLRKARLGDKLHIIMIPVVVCIYFNRDVFLKFVNIVAQVFGFHKTYGSRYSEEPRTLMALLCIIAIYSICFRKQIRAGCGDSDDYFIALYLMAIFMSLGGGAILRISWYFGVFLCLLLPEIFKTFIQKKAITCISSFALLALYVFSNNIKDYAFFWQQ